MPMFQALGSAPRRWSCEGADGPLCRGLAADPRDDGRPDPGGRTPVARRGVPRPVGHRAPAWRPARGDAARLVRRMETELGITGSIGLSHNKFLAKVASDLDKPRGFRRDRKAETAEFLRDRKPVRLIWGVGEVGQAALEAAGIRTFADLLRWDRRDLHARFGQMGERLWHLARGEDHRRVSAHEPVKSASRTRRPSTRTRRSRHSRRPHLAAVREGRDRAKAKAIWRARGHAQAQAGEPQPADAPHQPARSHADGRPDLPRRARAVRPGRDAGPFRLLGVGLSELVPRPRPTPRATCSIPMPPAARRPSAPWTGSARGSGRRRS
jgi:DNA polymerase IV